MKVCERNLGWSGEFQDGYPSMEARKAKGGTRRRLQVLPSSGILRGIDFQLVTDVSE
jgi:hypothetical protein